MLIVEGHALRRTHDLLDLAKRLPSPVMTRVSGDELDLLNVWATEGRYPADLDEATRNEAIECHAAAARLVNQMSAWVGRSPTDRPAEAPGQDGCRTRLVLMSTNQQRQRASRD